MRAGSNAHADTANPRADYCQPCNGNTRGNRATHSIAHANPIT